jgi:hypothetical protein
MGKLVLSRRQVLRGGLRGVTAAVGLPILDSMLNGNGDALASGTPLPRRFGVFYWGNGIVPKAWLPAETGPSWRLSPMLMPFAKVKDYVSIVSGTVVYSPYKVSGHFGSLLAITSAAPGIPQGGLNYAYSAPTFDQLIAERIGTATRFRSLELGVAATDASDADFGAVAKAISHNGPNSPNRPEHDPIALYDRVFGDGFALGPTPPVASATLAARKSVLDLVATDTRALQSRLPAPDRQRLDQHLQHVRDLERQLVGMPVTAAACRAPRRPASSYPPRNAQEIDWDPLAAAQNELLVYALLCDQTRVFSYRFSPCNDYTVYPGFPTFKIDPSTSDRGTSMHAMTHTEGGDQPGVQKCLHFSMGKFALLLERLLATTEGDGTLLDRCAILGFSECTEGRTHNAREQPGIPFIVAGRGGGSLVHPGIHYKSPLTGDADSETKGRNTSVVPLTLMQALGTGITRWGEGAGRATTVIKELLA